MKEAQMWGVLRKALTTADPSSDLTRIENVSGEGTPDVNACVWGIDFWCELKSVEAWPKRPGTILRIGHYTNEQRLWIRRRGRAGGKVLLCLRVGADEWLWFRWEAAFAVVGKVAKDQLLNACILYLKGSVPDLTALRFTLAHNPNADRILGIAAPEDPSVVGQNVRAIRRNALKKE